MDTISARAVEPGRVVFLARHGAIGAEHAGRYIGRSNPPLSNEGRRQARAMAIRLGDAGGSVSSIWSSPQTRAWETAEETGRLLGVGVRCHEMLAEMDFGSWEGKTFAEIEAEDPEALAAFAAGPRGLECPGGETGEQFCTRIASVAGELRAGSGGILVVAHGGVVRGLLCELLGLGTEWFWSFAIQHAALTELALWGRQAVLRRLNG